jgi:hypothetical protein
MVTSTSASRLTTHRRPSVIISDYPTVAKVSAIETAIARVVGCNPWIAIDTAVPHVVEWGRISDDDLAATEPMVRPVRIACGCASDRGYAHHEQYHDILHDASPSVKIIVISCTVFKISA